VNGINLLIFGVVFLCDCLRDGTISCELNFVVFFVACYRYALLFCVIPCIIGILSKPPSNLNNVYVVTDVLLQIQVFRDVAQCRLVNSYQCFVGVCCYHLQGLSSPRSDWNLRIFTLSYRKYFILYLNMCSADHC
jgi:hypothetical protein